LGSEFASPCTPGLFNPGLLSDTGGPTRSPVLSRPGFAPPCGVPTALVLFAHSPAGVGPSPMAPSYFAMRDAHLGFGFGGFRPEESFLHWVNDGLMAVFFFLVGLEIKRER
jgi:hypothetical protein